MTFTVFEDADRWKGYLAKAGMLGVTAVGVGGREQHLFGKDWRRQSVDQWVEDRVRAVVAPVAEWPGHRPPPARMTSAVATCRAPRSRRG